MIVISTTSAAVSIWVPTESAWVNESEILAMPKMVPSRSEVTSEVWKKPTGSAWVALFSVRNSARKIGICSRSGRQEASGLVPVSL